MFCEKNLGPTSFFVFQELEEIPGFVHAFTSRRTDSSNKSAKHSGELALEKGHFLQAMGLRLNELVFLDQVHSSRVVTVKRPPSECSESTSMGPADGVITVRPAQFPIIQTADCLPIVVLLAEKKQVCVLHTGWRGTRDQITTKGVVQFLQETQASPSQLIAALGPCIQKCCYQVGPEVRTQYGEAGHDVDRCFSGRQLDLVEANSAQLQALGVTQILDSKMCTACRTDLFYSYRKEGKTGRMWLLAGFQL
jgi:YfiH family protein